MIGLVIASVIQMAMMQSSAADGARKALVTCLHDAVEEAKAQKVGAAGFNAFAAQKCSAQAMSFKSAVWAFDAKNKVSKKQSESDSQAQVDDYLATSVERYEMAVTPN
jgi:hypothetical protein